MSARDTSADDDVPGLRRPVIAGLATILVAFGGFFGWATFARLDAAAIAPGVVITDSNRKQVQHLEGGIVADILVRDGDQVRQGDVLLRMDATFAHARLSQLETQREVAGAALVRLAAEAAGERDAQAFEPLLAAAASEAGRQTVRDARGHFLSR